MYAILNQLLNPFVLLILVLCYLAFRYWRRGEGPRRWRVGLLLAAVGLYLYCTPAVAYLLLGSLEWPYPPSHSRPDGIEAIVILSGSIYVPDDVRPEAVLGERTLYRCLRGAELFAEGDPCPIAVTGGKVDAARPGPTLARAMVDLMHHRFGIAEEHFHVEETSRTTFENAENTSRWLQEQGFRRIALVTDAAHLRRSARCFEAFGIEVVPVGCAYRATKFHWTLEMFLPSPDGASSSQAAIHEHLGLLWYWIKGRI